MSNLILLLEFIDATSKIVGRIYKPYSMGMTIELPPDTKKVDITIFERLEA